MLYNVAGDEMFDGKKWKACAYESKECNHAWCPDYVSTLDISNHEVNCGWKYGKGIWPIYVTPPLIRKKRQNGIQRKEDHWLKEAKKLKTELDKATTTPNPTMLVTPAVQIEHRTMSVEELIETEDFVKGEFFYFSLGVLYREI